MKTVLTAFIVFVSFSAANALDKTQPSQVVEILVTENGFEPSQIEVSADAPVVLKVTRKTDNTCATEIQMKDRKIKKALPKIDETVSVDLGKLKKGDHPFSCGMNMISGKIVVK
jgi:plastocyanin domain-containing protein